MALVASSQNITDQNATPVVKVSTLKKGAPVRTAHGHILAASFVGGTVGQWYAFVRVPARARVLTVRCTNATSTTGAVKVGLFRPNSGIAISDAVFATAFVLGAANNRAQVDTVPTVALRVADLATAYSTAVGTASATADQEYDIVATIVTVLGAAVDCLFEVDYVLPE